jgi:hypothetical protein
MTDVLASSEVATVATTVDDPSTGVSSLVADVGLVGDPAAKLSLVASTVATVVTDPGVRVSDISVCVLRNPLTYRSFRAIWVD